MRYLHLTLVAMITQASAVAQQKVPSATQILKEAERIRSLDEAELLVQLSTKSKSETQQYKLKITRKQGRKAFVEFLAPAEEVGRFLTANQFRYWTIFPDSRRVFAISRKEAIGNSSFDFADIFQLDAEEDYTATIISNSKQPLSGSKDTLRLSLKAKHDEAPYARIEYQVRASDSFPIQANFFGESGRELKVLRVLESKKLGGRLRPSKLEMKDSINPDKVSVWNTLSMQSVKVPDSIFTTSFLKSKK